VTVFVWGRSEALSFYCGSFHSVYISFYCTVVGILLWVLFSVPLLLIHFPCGPKEYSHQFSSDVSFRLMLFDGPNFAATCLARNLQPLILVYFWT